MPTNNIMCVETHLRPAAFTAEGGATPLKRLYGVASSACRFSPCHGQSGVVEREFARLHLWIYHIVRYCYSLKSGQTWWTLMHAAWNAATRGQHHQV